MAKDLNQCNFIGRTGADVEVKFLPSGNAVANFSIACSDDYIDKTSGDKVPVTNWINIVAFGRLGEICGEYLKKGSQVFVSGKQVTRKWQDQSGADKYTTEIHISDMKMLGSKGDSQGGSSAPQAKPQQQGANRQPAPQSFDSFDDD